MQDRLIFASGVRAPITGADDLARAMGGDVTAESTAGVGSVFTIDLPAAAMVDVKSVDPFPV